MIFMFVPSIGVRSSAFNLPESLLEPEHALDLPLDFVKTQAQTQRLEGIPSRWRGCHTGAHCRAFWIRDDFTFSRAWSQTFLSCQKLPSALKC